MSSPYIRRLQLGARLRALRTERGMTIDALASLVDQSRTSLNRMEIGQQRPDLAKIMTILDVFDITGRNRDALISLAREAAVKGWWHSYGASITPHEHLAADLESGADIIQEYHPAGIPDLLQTAEFTAAMIDLNRTEGPLLYRPDRLAEARKRRQQRLMMPGRPAYDAVLDESALLRLDIPAKVMSAQLGCLIDLITSRQNITVRVWPHNSRFPNGPLPLVPMSCYIFPDLTDPSVTVVTTPTGERVISNPDKVHFYARTYNHLATAALSPGDTMPLLETLAKSASRKRNQRQPAATLTST